MTENSVKTTGKRLKAAMAFAGFFIGAGFVSGAELMQFFGSFGLPGLLAMPAALVLMGLLAYTVMDGAVRLKTVNAARLFNPAGSRITDLLFVLLQEILLLGACSIMLAGIGAQLELLIGLPARFGSLLAAGAALAIMLAGMGKILDTFSLIMPVLIAAVVIFAVLALKNGSPAPPVSTGKYPGAFFVMGINYASYNFFGVSPVLVQLSATMPEKKDRRFTVAAGTLALVLIASSIMLALCTDSTARESELPMTAFAGGIAPALGTVYGILLMLGMFGSELSCGYGAAAVLTEGSAFFGRHRKLCLAALALLCYVCSLFGFGNLIGTVYPACGYAGAVFVVIMVWNYLKNIKSL